jgi:hypothetical protein
MKLRRQLLPYSARKGNHAEANGVSKPDLRYFFIARYI